MQRVRDFEARKTLKHLRLDIQSGAHENIHSSTIHQLPYLWSLLRALQQNATVRGKPYGTHKCEKTPKTLPSYSKLRKEPCGHYRGCQAYKTFTEDSNRKIKTNKKIAKTKVRFEPRSSGYLVAALSNKLNATHTAKEKIN